VETAFARVVASSAVCTGQTSIPSHCMANPAALLPTWPKETWDCTLMTPMPATLPHRGQGL